MNHRLRSFSTQLILVLSLLLFLPASALRAQTQKDSSSPASSPDSTAAELGVTFVPGSNSKIILERNGKRYVVDAATHSVSESSEKTSAASEDPPAASSSVDKPQTQAQSQTQTGPPAETPKVYEPGEDLVFSVPTGRRLDRHGFYINFTHRFPYSAAFSGVGRGGILLGLDDFSASSFGFRYGITSKLSVAAYRSPSIISRPIEFMVAYNLLDEHDGQPLNLAVRYSIDGQNNFQRNFTNNFELVMSRSVTHRAQFYLVPTVSIHNRPVIGAIELTTPPAYMPCSAPAAAGLLPAIFARPCANTFSLGIAAAVDVRPSVALVAEAIPTLANGGDLGIHRPAYSFGIQKKLWRHAFTFGFTNSVGTTVSQRAGTRATFLLDPAADKPSGMFVGFNLMRQVY